ncbi:hypothetical protein [Psychroserpens damuponensis]|uniref:hypothetical protein n=1 Tax=Psychroserpens damuponensis TaxID=943936 RepID=UPI00059054A3|nr:hypothetical protein [Psychroserpens damuponensis]
MTIFRTCTTVVLLLIIFSCAKREDDNRYEIYLAHYQRSVSINLPKQYDTLNIWNNYSDNIMDDRKYYRVQNSNLPLLMESGFAFSTDITQFEQFTISEPLSLGDEKFFPPFESKTWASEKKQMLEEEKVNIEVIIDSITINNTDFGVLKVISPYSDSIEKIIIFATNLDNERIEFTFFTNLPQTDHFFQESLAAMKTLEIYEDRI